MPRLKSTIRQFVLSIPALSVPTSASAAVIVIYGDAQMARPDLAEHCLIFPRFNSAWTKNRSPEGIEEQLKIRSLPKNWAARAPCPQTLRGTRWYDWVYDEPQGVLYRYQQSKLAIASVQRWLSNDDVDVRTSYVADVVNRWKDDGSVRNTPLLTCAPCRAYHRAWADEDPERQAARARVVTVTALLAVPEDPTELLVKTYLGQAATLREGIVLKYQGGAWRLQGSGSAGPQQELTSAVKFSLYEHPGQCVLRRPEVPAWPTSTGWLAALAASAAPQEIPFELEPRGKGSCAVAGGDVVTREPAQLEGKPSIAKKHQHIADLLLHWPRVHLADFVAAFDWYRLRRRPDGQWRTVDHRREIRVRDPALLQPVVSCSPVPDTGTTWSSLLCPADTTLTGFEGAFRWYD